MRSFAELAKYAKTHPVAGDPNPEVGGYYEVKTPTGVMRVIASWAEGWDHVSVSRPNRCPTWAEMDFVKRVFFKPDEFVFQAHPAESDYINIHPFCLHLWRPQHEKIPIPPKYMV